MCVRLVTARNSAVVRFVRGVDVRVLLAVRTVGEPPVTPGVLALEWLLSWNIMHYYISNLRRHSIRVFIEIQ